jgi:hypothetical protein
MDLSARRDNLTAQFVPKDNPGSQGSPTARLARKDSRALQNQRRNRSVLRKRRASATNSQLAVFKLWSAAEHCSAAVVSRAVISERLHHRQIDEAHGRSAGEYFNGRFLVIAGRGEKMLFTGKSLTRRQLAVSCPTISTLCD